MLDQTQKKFSLVTTQPGHISVARDVTEDARPEKEATAGSTATASRWSKR